ncbi:hypothetical protein PHLCEN_2v4723 [Hermanssonia centrifuga]|uniref:PLC-like phosphodiesterase n=1 Tax=Hermanssonia centrifuga TaxID=98765 RepID=A0A2R6PJD3_9APHY|nr:hypothetical protein PHLCEN_2v4723 [Hermanssonia centrifuga]
MQKVYVEWDQSIFDDQGDDGGEVVYGLTGTSNQFQLQARATDTSFNLQAYFTAISTANNPQGSTINLGWVHDGNTVFILSGTAGNYHSINPPSNWMQNSLPTIGNRLLRHISIPGSHDAGMSFINGSTFFGSDDEHVLTQTLSIGGQLARGSRYFDLRPTISSGIFKAGHYSTFPVIGYQGANGESFSSIISDINSFTANNAELIILNLSHDLNSDNYSRLKQNDWNNLFQQLSGIRNLFVAPNPTTVDLSRLALRQFIGSGQAAVIVIVQPPGDTSVTLGSWASQGFYNATTQFAVYDNYSNSNDVNYMSQNQLTLLAQQRSNPNNGEFLLSWTLTQQAIDFTQKDAPSIIGYGNIANNALFTSLPPAISSTVFPNIIYIDNFNRTDVTALAVAINDIVQINDPAPTSASSASAPTVTATASEWGQCGVLLAMSTVIVEEQ